MQGSTMIALLYGLDNKAWTILDYPTNGRYVKFGHHMDHGLDMVDYWTPLKVTT